MKGKEVSGLAILSIGGALGYFLFEPIMSAAAARGISVDTIISVGAILAALILAWEVVARLRR
jgi:hypothetical protein